MYFEGKILKDTDVLVDAKAEDGCTMHLVVIKGNVYNIIFFNKFILNKSQPKLNNLNNNNNNNNNNKINNLIKNKMLTKVIFILRYFNFFLFIYCIQF